MTRSFSSWPVFLVVAAVVLILDQASKIAVVEAGLVGPSAVILGLANFLYRENRGGAWGFLAGASESFRMPFFVGTSLLAIVFLIWLRRKMIVHRRWAELAFPAVLGGAVGNLVDRVRLGYVIDFIDCHVAGAHWPTFNVADIGITVGVVVLVGDSIFVPRRVREAEAASASASTPSDSGLPALDDAAGSPDAWQATPVSAEAGPTTPTPTSTPTGGEGD
jgi:signal peptidase II